MKNLVIILCTVLCFTSCDRLTSKPFYLDNPTEKAISVTIDEIAYDLPPDHAEKIQLQIGSHQMTLPDGQTVKFCITDKSRGGVINPTRSIYIKHKMTYAVSDKSADMLDRYNSDKEVTIDGIPYEGPINTISDLFIDNKNLNYDYSIRTPYPDEVSVQGNQLGTYKTKLFTKKEFIEFCEEEDEDKGFHEQNKEEGAVDVPTQSYIVEMPATPHFSIPELQATVESMGALLRQYQVAKDHSEQQKIETEYKALYEKMEKEAKPLDDFEKYKSQDERNAFIQFQRGCENIMDAGITEVK